MTHFCYECYAEREIRRVTRETEVPIRGEQIAVTTAVDECTVCGNPVPTPESEGGLLKAAYDEYRRRHGLPAPAEIRRIRARYGLSQRSLARLLNWGTITVHRYEQGALPDASHSSLIKSLDDPQFILRLLDEPGCGLSPDERSQLRTTLVDETQGERSRQIAERLESLFTEMEPSELTGYRRPSPERLADMAAYLAGRVVGDFFRVRMMKLLFYADFCHFARESVSISGFPYAALPMGPVPDQYQLFLTWAQLRGRAETEVVETTQGPGVVFVSCTKYEGGFSSTECRTLDAVIDSLGGMTGSQLADLSHKELAWINTPLGHRISYGYATQLVGGPCGTLR